MSILQYQLFVSVASTLNFSRTAEQFFISQPAVTHHIKALESSLGVTLFNRSSKKIVLTEEGLEFLQYADQALKVISTGETRIRNMSQGRTGHIRIAALSSTTKHLGACLARLYELHTAIQVDVDLLEGNDLVNALQKGLYDFFFLIGDMLANTDDYESEPIFKDTLELFINNNIIDSIDVSDWKTVACHPFVSVYRADAWLTNRIRLICKNRGIVPNIINYYNRAEAAVLSVNTGVGIAILPGELKNLYQRPNVTALPIIGEDAEISYSFAWKQGSRSTASDLFKDLVMAMYS